MQSSQRNTGANGPGRVYNPDMQDQESFCWAPIRKIEHLPSSYDASQGMHLSVEPFEQCSNLESFCGNDGYVVHNSPSTASFSPNDSPLSPPNSQSYPSDFQDSSDNTCGSPVIRSCVTNNVNDFRHKLRELETVMLGPDSDNLDSQISLIRGDLKDALCACANAVANNDMFTTEWLMTELRKRVSVTGEPIQRLGAYMLEGLVAKLASSGSAIYKALRCKEPAGAELLSYMHILYEVCPYFKFGYMSANGAIAESMKDEHRVHIIDFQIAQGSQWFTLIQALAARPGGPPHVRITGIDDSTSAYARGGGIDIVGQRLTRLAESCKVPFEFCAAGISACDIQLGNLGIRPGEAIAVNFPLMLHHMPDESVSTQNPRDRLLRLVKSMSPKVVTLVEQESNTNTAPFVSRFREAMNYYLAIFESIDVTFPRDHKERINVEQHCLAREIVNIIACEGAARVERHEPLGKWRSRFMMAGFKPYPLSSYVNATIKTLLASYSEQYTLEEKDGALFLGWTDRPLVASCAWR